jgi:Tfp pilus assembly protein PilV
MIRPRKAEPRRGMLAIAVLVCLIVLTMIAGALLRVEAARREEVRSQERRLQAEWLAEAGIQRALARLAAEPAYTGETWNVEARDLGTADAATVTIAVERPPDDPKGRTIRARADYPRDPPRRARSTRQITIPATDRARREAGSS